MLYVLSFDISMHSQNTSIFSAIIGGSSPALATWLVDNYGIHSPGFMISTIACISLFGLFVAPTQEFHETHTHRFNETDSDLFLTRVDTEEDDDDVSFETINQIEIV